MKCHIFWYGLIYWLSFESSEPSSIKIKKGWTITFPPKKEESTKNKRNFPRKNKIFWGSFLNLFQFFMTAVLNEWKCFGGFARRYSHTSEALGNLTAKFHVFVPPHSSSEARDSFPVLFCLAGLTCTDETFAHKAGAQAAASRLGIALVFPDTV